MDNYTKSNEYTEIPNIKISKETKHLFNILREKITLMESDMEMLCHMMSKDLKVSSIKSLRYGGTEPHSVNGKGTLRGKTLGTYCIGKQSIMLYMYTAKQKKVRATKSVLDTLLHEYCHHLDFVLFNMTNSLHTAGFYKRISHLKSVLLS
jgi:hypothetical protein